MSPGVTIDVMDALMDGWALGRSSQNTHFTRWEDELDTPLDQLRERFGISARVASA